MRNHKWILLCVVTVISGVETESDSIMKHTPKFSLIIHNARQTEQKTRRRTKLFFLEYKNTLILLVHIQIYRLWAKLFSVDTGNTFHCRHFYVQYSTVLTILNKVNLSLNFVICCRKLISINTFTIIITFI